MASIKTGSEAGGKKAVDADIPLVPFIDLLLCCVMFLLVTAVWNQLASVQVHQQTPTPDSTPAEPPPAEPRLVLLVQQSGFVLASDVGDRIDIPKNGDVYDLEALRDRLVERRRVDANRTSIVIAPEDGVVYQSVMRTMDVATGAGYGDIALENAGGV